MDKEKIKEAVEAARFHEKQSGIIQLSLECHKVLVELAEKVLKATDAMPAKTDIEGKIYVSYADIAYDSGVNNTIDKCTLAHLKILEVYVKRDDLPSAEDLGMYLYKNQPECFGAIALEKRAEASYDIAKAIIARRDRVDE